MKHLRKLNLLLAGLLCGLFAVLPATALAADSAAKTSGSTAVSTTTGGAPQPYPADTNLQIGTIVQVDEKAGKKVTPATYDDLSRMFGVIASPDGLPITVTPADTSSTTVYVATEGRYNVLVSDQNGVIKAGDPVTVSNLAGTAMKATVKERVLFGKALENFDGKSNVIGKTELKYNNGQAAKTVSLGMIQVAIDIKNNPDILSTKTKLPPVLERIGLQIAEKPLSPFRIYLSVGITVITIIITIIVLYGGIRTSIISIGRNPLSKKSIFRALLQIILVAFIILIIGLFAVYLLLKL